MYSVPIVPVSPLPSLFFPLNFCILFEQLANTPVSGSFPLSECLFMLVFRNLISIMINSNLTMMTNQKRSRHCHPPPRNC
jgi:hypothetical protein